MTKFKNYLNEEFENLQDNYKDFIIDTVKLLKKDCNSYIKEVKKNNTILYSGRQSSESFIKKSIRKNRKPVDMDRYFHDYIDKEFYKQYGIKPRSNSLFCYSKIFPKGHYEPETSTTYSSYGHSFYVFPIGDYKITYNPKVVDLYRNVQEFKRKIGPFPEAKQEMDWVEDLVKGYKVQKTLNLNEIKDRKFEINLIADSVYLLRISWLSTNNLSQDFFEKLFK